MPDYPGSDSDGPIVLSSRTPLLLKLHVLDADTRAYTPPRGTFQATLSRLSSSASSSTLAPSTSNPTIPQEVLVTADPLQPALFLIQHGIEVVGEWVLEVQYVSAEGRNPEPLRFPIQVVAPFAVLKPSGMELHFATPLKASQQLMLTAGSTIPLEVHCKDPATGQLRALEGQLAVTLSHTEGSMYSSSDQRFVSSSTGVLSLSLRIPKAGYYEAHIIHTPPSRSSSSNSPPLFSFNLRVSAPKKPSIYKRVFGSR